MHFVLDAVVFAVFSFCAQLLLQFLRGGSSVQVRLVQHPSQIQILNYEIRNVGSAPAREVHVTFSRQPATRQEMWTTDQKQDLRFDVLVPGES